MNKYIEFGFIVVLMICMFILGYCSNELIENTKLDLTAKTSYLENCAMKSLNLLRELRIDGFNVSYVKGWVAHDWIICYNCTAYYDMWFDYDGTVIYAKHNYQIRQINNTIV